jgi:uncharacterized membrane protein
MTEVELTLNRVVKVWWSLFWRGVLFGGGSGFLLGFIIGFGGALIGIPRQTGEALATLATFLVGVPIGILIIRTVLRKRFSDFRIALVADEYPLNAAR